MCNTCMFNNTYDEFALLKRSTYICALDLLSLVRSHELSDWTGKAATLYKNDLQNVAREALSISHSYWSA